MRIAIVAGHGGPDKGAVSKFTDFNEADFVLQVAVRSAALSIPGADVLLTRTDATTPHKLHQRVQACTRWGAQLVLELHCDAGGPNAHGLRTYHFPGNPVTRAIGNFAVKRAPQPLTGRLLSTAVNARAYPRAFNLMSKYPMPVLLIELGFVTSEYDVYYFQQPGSVDTLADWVAGVAKQAVSMFTVAAD